MPTFFSKYNTARSNAYQFNEYQTLALEKMKPQMEEKHQEILESCKAKDYRNLTEGQERAMFFMLRHYCGISVTPGSGILQKRGEKRGSDAMSSAMTGNSVSFKSFILVLMISLLGACGSLPAKPMELDLRPAAAEEVAEFEALVKSVRADKREIERSAPQTLKDTPAKQKALRELISDLYADTTGRLKIAKRYNTSLGVQLDKRAQISRLIQRANLSTNREWSRLFDDLDVLVS